MRDRADVAAACVMGISEIAAAVPDNSLCGVATAMGLQDFACSNFASQNSYTQEQSDYYFNKGAINASIFVATNVAINAAAKGIGWGLEALLPEASWGAEAAIGTEVRLASMDAAQIAEADLAPSAGLQSELAAAEANLGSVPLGKTVTANQAAVRTLSGWTPTEGFQTSPELVGQVLTKGEEVGLPFQPHIFDAEGVPGSYFASHAEPQLSLFSDTFAVSKNMCPSCRSFVSQRAVVEGRTFVVQDPSKVWTFSPTSTSWVPR